MFSFAKMVIFGFTFMAIRSNDSKGYNISGGSKREPGTRSRSNFFFHLKQFLGENLPK